MTRFRPSVEALDDRALPSAVFAGPADPSAGHAAHFALRTSEPAGQADGPTVPVTAREAATAYLRITLSDVLISSYN